MVSEVYTNTPIHFVQIKSTMKENTTIFSVKNYNI